MLEDANIWISDMVEIDPTIELPNEENQKVDLEKYISENIFTWEKTE